MDWNVSESGVHPLRVEELADDPASVAALMTQALGYPQTNGTVELRERDRGHVPGCDAGPCRSHQRRLGGQLPRPAAPRRAGRRSRGDDAELHAGPRSGARSRSDSQKLAARPRLAVDASTSIRLPRSWEIEPSSSSSATRTTRPGRGWAPPSSMGSAASPTGSAPGWCPTKFIEAPSSTAVETPTVWGRSERAIVTSGLSKAYGLPGLAHRVGRWPSPSRRRALGHPRLHIDRARRHQRSAGADGARAGAARAAARPHARHSARQLSSPPTLARRPRAARFSRASRGGRHRLRPLSSRHQLDAPHRAAERRIERARRAGRSLRDGRIPADRFRIGRVASGRQPGADRRAARHDSRRRLADAR